MKQLYIIIFTFFLALINIKAQTVTTVATGLSGPVGIALDGNDLYIAEFNGNKISKNQTPNPKLLFVYKLES